MNELRHAWRSIARMPVVATVIVVSLGVGIGVNTAVFSWIEAVVLKPLPGVVDAGGLMLVEPRADTGSYPGVSWREYGDLRDRLTTLSEPIAFRFVPFNVGERGSVQRSFGLLVSGNYFSALGLKPAGGRLLEPSDGADAGCEPVVVISHDYWTSHFNGDTAVIGRSIRINDQLVTIVGVAPDRFQGTVLGLNFDLWAPATAAPVLFAGSRELDDRSMRGYNVMGRLARGVPLPEAQGQLDRTMATLAREYPETNRNLRAELLPFWQAPRGPQRMLANALMILQAIMLVLLLAVCGNTANLVLARASARQREIGVRLALGASRLRVIVLLLTENLALGLLGAALGAAIAVWATESMRAVPIIGSFPIKFQTSVDLVGLGFAMGLGAICGLIFGIFPALQLSSVDPQAALRAGARTDGRSALRNTLMAIEVALAIVVLLAAGIFFRSFSDSHGIDPGFKREGLLLAAYDIGARTVPAAEARAFARRLLDGLRALPGVESAAIALSVPLDIHGLPMRSFTIEGRGGSEAEPYRALTNTVSPGYFKTMTIPFRRGSDFVDLADTASPAQAIVNEEFVHRWLGDSDPLGRHIESIGAAYVIAGVVRNSISESFDESPIPVIYLSLRDRPSAGREIHLRTHDGAELLLGPQVERLVRDLDPAVPVFNVRTMSDHIERNLFLRRIPARMFVVLGPALLILAAIGIYAVVAYTVSHRTTEIGVRLALGATGSRVVRQIVVESLRVIAVGAMAGWLIAFAVDLHLMKGIIYLSVFAGVPAILLAVATVACWVPARRATSVDPLQALRHE